MSVSYEVTATLRAEMHSWSPIVLVYDARGNGGGGVCPTITGDHQDRITDYTAIVLATPHPPTADMPQDLELSAQAVGTTGGQRDNCFGE